MSDEVSRLNRLDSCAVSDAMDKLGLRGVVTGIHQYSTQRRIAGRVVTVKLGIDDGRPTAARHLSTTAIETAQPGDVIVVEQRTGVDAAAWGGNLSLGAKVRGIAGVICEGPARDIDESRQHDFPVYARDHTCTTARGRLIEVATNERIIVGTVLVSAGDYVLADASAVVFIRQADISRVLEAAEMIVEKEKRMAEGIRAGTPISQVMGADYEAMLKPTSTRLT
ncbi:MAG TPA: RraA family protein [Terriglobia bacterium]|nr:RraA family protein [Terriglobia bacterium]